MGKTCPGWHWRSMWLGPFHSCDAKRLSQEDAHRRHTRLSWCVWRGVCTASALWRTPRVPYSLQPLRQHSRPLLWWQRQPRAGWDYRHIHFILRHSWENSQEIKVVFDVNCIIRRPVDGLLMGFSGCGTDSLHWASRRQSVTTTIRLSSPPLAILSHRCESPPCRRGAIGQGDGMPDSDSGQNQLLSCCHILFLCLSFPVCKLQVRRPMFSMSLLEPGSLLLLDLSCVSWREAWMSAWPARVSAPTIPFWAVLGPKEQAPTYFSRLLFPPILMGFILTLELSLFMLHWSACFCSNWSMIHMAMGLSSEHRLR